MKHLGLLVEPQSLKSTSRLQLHSSHLFSPPLLFNLLAVTNALFLSRPPFVFFAEELMSRERHRRTGRRKRRRKRRPWRRGRGRWPGVWVLYKPGHLSCMSLSGCPNYLRYFRFKDLSRHLFLKDLLHALYLSCFSAGDNDVWCINLCRVPINAWYASLK